MENQERRKKILEMLKEATKPVTGTEMAQVCQVSRQIIVGDIALLRVGGTPVISTPRGYQLQQVSPYGVQESLFVQTWAGESGGRTEFHCG